MRSPLSIHRRLRSPSPSPLRHPQSPLTLAATSGFGVVIFLGGCLNLLRTITSPVLITFTILGLLAAILLRITINGTDTPSPTPFLQKPSAVSKAVPILLLVAALVFIVRIAATVHTQSYQASDDYNFYLAAPAKMLQLHHYAADPFSERRIMSSIGGNYYLQTLVLAVLPLADVQMADRALGLLLLAFLAFALASEFRLTPPQRAVFALLLFTTPQLVFNLTFVLLPSALFFALVCLAANRKLLAEDPTLQALLLGAVTGVLATTKSTYLPHGVIFIACFALFQARRRGLSAATKALVLAALSCLIVMAPWMMASHATSGTWFYPSLGKGYQYSAYGLYPAPSGAGLSIILRKVVPFCAPSFSSWASNGISGTAMNRAKPFSLSRPPPSAPPYSSASAPVETPSAATTTPASSQRYSFSTSSSAAAGTPSRAPAAGPSCRLSPSPSSPTPPSPPGATNSPTNTTRSPSVSKPPYKTPPSSPPASVPSTPPSSVPSPPTPAP
ncbi:hypothetical protein [Tunturiibacter gelidiferens]|uniref:hypothetical protein n=1 Tax=Tunturiibacter gelidiferens TaxID=3069689 RepID=UPI003D9B731E